MALVKHDIDLRRITKMVSNGFTFKLKFLTKEIELDSNDFETIGDVKKKIQQEYKIHFGAQVILHRGMVLESFRRIHDVFLKMVCEAGQNSSKQELCLNLVVNKKSLEIQIIPKILDHKSAIPLISLDSCTVGNIKETLCKYIKELMDRRYIHLEKEDGTFLEDQYQLKDYGLQCGSKIYLKRMSYLTLYFDDLPNLIIGHLEIFENEGRTLYQVLKQIKKEKKLNMAISDENIRPLRRQLFNKRFDYAVDLSESMSSIYDLQLKVDNLSSSERCILI